MTIFEADNKTLNMIYKDTGPWLVETDHVTWTQASDWSAGDTFLWCQCEPVLLRATAGARSQSWRRGERRQPRQGGPGEAPLCLMSVTGITSSDDVTLLSSPGPKPLVPKPPRPLGPIDCWTGLVYYREPFKLLSRAWAKPYFYEKI